MSRLAIAVATVAALLAALAAVPSAAPAATKSKYVPFSSPSRNIQCAYVRGEDFPSQIRCDAKFLNDLAGVVRIRGRGRFERVTDAIGDPKAPILRYGKTRIFGSLRCTSRRSGMTCRSTKSGHGFFLSRESRRTF